MLVVGQDDRLQATSLLGAPLYAREIDGNTVRGHEFALAADPLNSRRYIFVANAYADLAALRQAVDVLTIAIGRLGPKPELLRERGRRRLSPRRFAEAVEDLSKASAAEPNDAFALYYLGLAKYLLGDWTGSIDAHQRGWQAEARDADKTKFLPWMHWAYRRLDQRAEAERVLQMAGGNVAESSSMLGVLRLMKGATDVSALRASPEYKEDGPTIEYGIGQWHLAQGAARAADQAFKSVVAMKEWNYFGYVAAEVWLAAHRRR